MDETILEWAERITSPLAWEEHERRAWTIGSGGCRQGGPSLSLEADVSLTRTFVDWRWRVKVTYGDTKIRLHGYTSTMASGKELAQRRLKWLLRHLANMHA